MPPVKPLVRSDVLASEIAGEMVLYDSRTHQAHCVTSAAVTVWHLADGSRTLEEIVAVSAAQGLVEVTVTEAFEEFARLGLLERGPTPVSRTSRRSMLQKAAGAAPLVVSIVAPTAADAASGRGFKQAKDKQPKDKQHKNK